MRPAWQQAPGALVVEPGAGDLQQVGQPLDDAGVPARVGRVGRRFRVALRARDRHHPRAGRDIVDGIRLEGRGLDGDLVIGQPGAVIGIAERLAIGIVAVLLKRPEQDAQDIFDGVVVRQCPTLRKLATLLGADIPSSARPRMWPANSSLVQGLRLFGSGRVARASAGPAAHRTPRTEPQSGDCGPLRSVAAAVVVIAGNVKKNGGPEQQSRKEFGDDHSRSPPLPPHPWLAAAAIGVTVLAVVAPYAYLVITALDLKDGIEALRARQPCVAKLLKAFAHAVLFAQNSAAVNRSNWMSTQVLRQKYRGYPCRPRRAGIDHRPALSAARRPPAGRPGEAVRRGLKRRLAKATRLRPSTFLPAS